MVAKGGTMVGVWTLHETCTGFSCWARKGKTSQARAPKEIAKGKETETWKVVIGRPSVSRGVHSLGNANQPASDEPRKRMGRCSQPTVFQPEEEKWGASAIHRFCIVVLLACCLTFPLWRNFSRKRIFTTRAARSYLKEATDPAHVFPPPGLVF